VQKVQTFFAHKDMQIERVETFEAKSLSQEGIGSRFANVMHLISHHKKEDNWGMAVI
jgi:hypothetical protein